MRDLRIDDLVPYVPTGEPVPLMDWYAYGEAAMCCLGLCWTSTPPEAARVYAYLDNALQAAAATHVGDFRDPLDI